MIISNISITSTSKQTDIPVFDFKINNTKQDSLKHVLNTYFISNICAKTKILYNKCSIFGDICKDDSFVSVKYCPFICYMHFTDKIKNRNRLIPLKTNKYMYLKLMLREKLAV